MEKSKNLVIEGARLIFRNFSGKAGQYNAEGMRNFCILLDRDLAATLARDGWNVRYLQPRDRDEEDQPYIQVSVRYDNYPPKIVLISTNGKSEIHEESVSLLDWAEIADADVVLNPYVWGPINGKSGIKAYLKQMYVTIAEDTLESKYINVPDSASDAIGGCGNCDTCSGSCNCHNGDVPF